jgi:hypothetical protein
VTTRSRFDKVVAAAIAFLFGVLAFFLVGREVFVYSVFLAPAWGPVLLGAGALGGLWLAVRGRGSARGFGTGLLVGWLLLAFWTSWMSVFGLGFQP